ncbi:MAG TPA: isoprenylcysteine carboxylmethyltransferase family protein [Verrucomicrobiae bacterium]|nr:isoprenylcysteine carboxylmethyltransferase family protein [Verrucomicrobiae bacterium]
MDAFNEFLAGCWAFVIGYWIVSAFFVKRTSTKQPLSHRVWYLALMAIAIGLLCYNSRLVHFDRALFRRTIATKLAGDCVALLGAGIAIWARASLGRNWSSRVTLKKDHELIETGPYRLVRHPIYSGLLLMIIGTAITTATQAGFVALSVCFCGFWIKLRQEERLLSRNLAGYPEYMRRTKALVPFVL